MAGENGENGGSDGWIGTVLGTVGNVASDYFKSQDREASARIAQERSDTLLQRQYAREDAFRTFTQQLTGTKYGYAVLGLVALAVVALVLRKKV